MIRVNKQTAEIEASGEMSELAKELVIAIGLICDKYQANTGKELGPIDLVMWGVKLLGEEVGADNVQ